MAKAIETARFQQAHSDKYINHLEKKMQDMKLVDEEKTHQINELKRRSQ